MRGGWRFSSLSLAALMVYAVISVLILRPPLTSVADHRRHPRIRSALGADSIVFVALGPAARSPSLLYALTSLREEGGWDGQVHVIVEHEDDLDCLSSYLRQSVTAIAVAPPPPPPPPGDTSATNSKPGGVVQHAKMAKMKLLDLLPPEVRRVVYVDCDVITQSSLGPFLDAVAREWDELDRKANGVAAAAAALEGSARTTRSTRADRIHPRLQGGLGPERLTASVTSEGGTNEGPLLSPSTLMIFADAGGHTIPICWECDVAHSGVVALARGHSERCLELWHNAFEGSGGGHKGTATDQEALDIALRKGSGCKALMLDRRHLSFMKDAFVMVGLTRTSTFGHFTGLLHPERLGKGYRRFYERALGVGFEEWGRGEIQACALG